MGKGIENFINDERDYNTVKSEYDKAYQIYEQKINDENFQKNIENLRLRKTIKMQEIWFSFLSFIGSILTLMVTICMTGFFAWFNILSGNKDVDSNKIISLIKELTIGYFIIIFIANIMYSFIKHLNTKRVARALICIEALSNVKGKNNVVINEVVATVDKEYKLSTILSDVKQIKDFLGIK